MPLKHYSRRFFVDPDKFEESEFIRVAKKKMGKELYDLAVSVFSEFIRNQDKDKSGGYFIFASIMGIHNYQKCLAIRQLWNGMTEKYGNTEEADDTIHRVLGTICMICVARDPRRWIYVEDEDKRLKLSLDKVPEPNKYFIGDYKVPKDLVK